MNQYPLTCTSVPSTNIAVVCMSGVHTAPVHGSECGNIEQVATPEKGAPDSEYVTTSICTMDTSNNKGGDIG